MKNKRHPQWIILAFSCLVDISSAQDFSVQLTYSTDNASTLILTSPNLTAQDSDAVQYSYDKTAGGSISGASALFYSESSVTGNSDNISGLSNISGSSSYYVATSTSSVWGTLAYETDDIVLYDPVLNSSSTFWEGDDYSTTGFNIDGLHVYPDGTFLLSTTNTETIYGLTIRDGDIALINPAASSASIFFDQDLFSSTANIDAISIEGTSGNLIFSTTNSESLAGVSFDDGDLVMWDGSAASVVFSENDHFNLSEDINALGSFTMTVPEPSSSLLFFASASWLLLLRKRN